MKNELISTAIILTMLLSSLSFITISSSAQSPLALDGSAKNGCGYVTSCSVSLTTVNPSNVIIVGCDCWPLGGSFSVKDTAGLTFSTRTAQLSIGGGQFIQTWYAIASTPLTSDSISVQTPLTGETWYGVIAFGVSGANLQSPFDTNPSIPKVQANINCPASYPCNTSVSTTNAVDFVFQFGGDTGYTQQTAGAGFTLIQWNSAGLNAYTQYEITSSRLSSATLSFGTSQGRDFGMITDALQPATTSTTSSTTTSSTSTTSSSSSTTSSSSSSATTTTSATSVTTSTMTETCQVIITMSSGEVIGQQVGQCK